MEFILTIIFLGAIIFIIWNLIVGKDKSQRKINDFTKKFNAATEKPVSVIEDNIKKVKKNIEKKISKSYLTGSSWIHTNKTDINILYTFRESGELLITKNGIVERASYELIIDNNSILITSNDITKHYNLVHVKNDFLFLNKVSSDEIIILANQTKYKDEVKANLNNMSKQYYSSEIQYIIEKSKYSIKEDYDHLFISACKTWQEINPGKSIMDFIDNLEKEAEKEGIHYEVWKRHNPNSDRFKYGEFLVSKNFFKS